MKGIKSFLATLLAFVLCLPLSPLVAYAESTVDAPPTEEATTTEPVEEQEEEATQNDEEAPAEEATSTEEEEATSDDEEEAPAEEDAALEAPVMLMAAPRRAPAAGSDTTWQSDWTYTLNDDAGTITLTGYSGSASDLVVPSKAVIDGTEYSTIYAADPRNSIALRSVGSVQSLSFEEGVQAPESAYNLFNSYGGTSLDVSNLDTSNTTSMEYMFAYMPNVTSLDTSMLNTSSVTNMNYMFYNSRALTSLTVNGMDTSNVKSVRYMFAYLTSLKTLDVSELDMSAANYDEGGRQTNMFSDFGGDLFDGTVNGTDAFENNQRAEGEEYRYPGYSYAGNYGITGPEGAERVWCLNANRGVPQSNYFKLIDHEDYLGDAYKKDGEKALTEDDLAKIAAAIVNQDKASSRSMVQQAIWDVTNGNGDGTRVSSTEFKTFFNDYVLANYEAMKGLYDMHIYVSENPQYQNLVGITRAYYSGAVLTIIKETEGEPEGMNRAFDLTLTVTQDGEPLAGQTISTHGVTDVMEEKAFQLDENGQATFSIYNGETIQIFNLPIGCVYTVEEVSKGYKLSGENLDGTLPDGQTVTRLVNTYAPEGEVLFGGTKTLEGRDFQAGDSFTFTITGSEGAPLPEVTSVTIEPTEGNEFLFTFGPLTFTKEDVGKTYTYTVTESGSGKGVTNDSAVHTITVTVEDPEDESRELLITLTCSDGETLVFVNTYEEEVIEEEEEQKEEEQKEEEKQEEAVEEKKEEKQSATVPSTGDLTANFALIASMGGIGAALALVGAKARKQD